MLRVVILGAAAGGGVPQCNCPCEVCRKERSYHPELQSTQAAIAFSAYDYALVSRQCVSPPTPAVDRDVSVSSQGRTTPVQPDCGLDSDL